MYAKLFASLYQGTLRGQSDEILVFTNLLAHSDEHGIVDKHWRAIAEETGISRDRVEAAIINLEAPDIESRSPESEGRRIIRMDEHRAWGWQIVNHGKYRAIRHEADRKEQNRQAQSRFREKSGNSKQIVSSVIDSKQNKPIQIYITDVDVDVDVDSKSSKDCAGPKLPTLPVGTEPPTVPRPRKTRTVEPAKTAATWAAYSNAYQDRYGVPPMRNAMVNGQMSRFCQRIAADESPAVAAFYVWHNGAFYALKLHPIGLLLADAEKLRTEWATGRQVTATAARQLDRKQNNYDVAEECRRLDREQGIVRTFAGQTFGGDK